MTRQFEAKTYFYNSKNAWMNQASLFNFSAQQLRESKYLGWMHATGIFRMCGEKVDFYAMGGIEWGVEWNLS